MEKPKSSELINLYRNKDIVLSILNEELESKKHDYCQCGPNELLYQYLQGKLHGIQELIEFVNEKIMEGEELYIEQRRN